jgi:hypothetical protein
MSKRRKSVWVAAYTGAGCPDEANVLDPRTWQDGWSYVCVGYKAQFRCPKHGPQQQEMFR